MKLHFPTSLDEAARLLAEDDDARPLAGGATLVAMMNAELVEPSALVCLRDIGELDAITRDDDGGARIGAMALHREVAERLRADGAEGVVKAAAGAIGHAPIRNMGTIGGAICHADPAADYPAALVAADAEIEVVGTAGARTIGADDFFVDYFETALEPGELVAGVRVAPSPDGTASSYVKFSRVEGDFATVSVAAVVTMRGGLCEAVRIALGGCAATPVRSPETEHELIGGGLGDGEIEAACRHLVAACDPIDDVRGSAAYRLKLVPGLVRRALDGCLAGETTS